MSYLSSIIDNISSYLGLYCGVSLERFYGYFKNGDIRPRKRYHYKNQGKEYKMCFRGVFPKREVSNTVFNSNNKGW